jgi:hypothetical protein
MLRAFDAEHSSRINLQRIGSIVLLPIFLLVNHVVSLFFKNGYASIPLLGAEECYIWL